MALIRPDVDWTVHHEGRVSLRAPKAESRLERARALLGDAGRDLFEVDFSRGELRVQGLISPIGISFGRGTGTLYLYINGRFVRDPVLRRAALEAYRHLIPKGRYPVLVLELTLPLDAVDGTCTPARSRCDFATRGHPLGRRGLRQASGTTAHAGWRDCVRARQPGGAQPSSRPVAWGSVLAPRLADPTQGSGPRTEALSEHRPAAAAPPSGWPRCPRRGHLLRHRGDSGAQQPASITPPADSPEGAESFRPQPELTPRSPVSSPGGAVPSPPQEEPLAPRGAASILPVPRFQDLKVSDDSTTYLVCEALGELILLDQHAAHERVSLHRLLQQADPLSVAQPFSPPSSLSSQQVQGSAWRTAGVSRTPSR